MLRAPGRRHTHRSESSQHVRQLSASIGLNSGRQGAMMQAVATAKTQGSNVRTAISLLSCSMMRVHTLVFPLAVPPETPADM